MKGWLFIILIMLGSLVSLTGLRQFFIEPLATPSVNAAWFVIQIAPLLFTIPGVMQGQLKSMFILCMVSTLYFIHGILVIFDPALFWFGTAELFFSLALCVISALFVRKLREFNGPPED